MPQPTAQKIGIAPGATVLVRGESRAAVAAVLGPLPEGTTVVEEAPAPDVVLLFAADQEQVRSQARRAHDLAGETGRFWIAYRKGARPLHRDTLQAELAPLGLDGVTLVSLDDVWSAMRVRTRR